MTLVELLVAVSISGLVLTGLMVTVSTLAGEQRRNFADTLLQHEAGMLQDSLTRELRFLSANESVVYGNPVSGEVPLYRRIVVARGSAATAPREEIYFETSSLSLLHDTNRNVSGTDVPIWRTDAQVKLRDVRFFPALKTTGVMDGSVINVFFEMDDDGLAGRKRTDGTVRTNTLRRTFSVKMRNP